MTEEAKITEIFLFEAPRAEYTVVHRTFDGAAENVDGLAKIEFDGGWVETEPGVWQRTAKSGEEFFITRYEVLK